MYAWSTLKRTVISTAQFLHGFEPFFTSKPKFWSPYTQIRFQRLFTGSYTLKGFQKHIKHEIKYHFNTIYQINPFLQKPSTTTQFILQFWNYEHPRCGSSTTTTHNNNNINKTYIQSQMNNNLTQFTHLSTIHNIPIYTPHEHEISPTTIQLSSNLYTQTYHYNMSMNFNN